ncbi:GNAT family N-acetyltransferase [Nitriliruptoraceae bacterium ZYF776]|nr:GNAT family N-acetyltransferase [Profundirhabdus halotolerans]
MRRLVPLTGDDAASLPGPCATCLFWELGAVRPETRTAAVAIGGGAGEHEPPSEPLVRKQAWISAQVQDGHPPGRSVQVDGEVVGYALYGPADRFASRGPLAPSASPEAFLLATVWVQPSWREHGLGRLLVQAALKDAHRADATAVEAYGDRRFRERRCLLPATWLLHEGFAVHREHPRTPLFRLDVKRTARWAESLEHALEEVLGVLPGRRPAPVPEGASPTARHHLDGAEASTDR